MTRLWCPETRAGRGSPWRPRRRQTRCPTRRCWVGCHEHRPSLVAAADELENRWAGRLASQQSSLGQGRASAWGSAEGCASKSKPAKSSHHQEVDKLERCRGACGPSWRSRARTTVPASRTRGEIGAAARGRAVELTRIPVSLSRVGMASSGAPGLPSSSEPSRRLLRSRLVPGERAQLRRQHLRSRLLRWLHTGAHRRAADATTPARRRRSARRWPCGS